MLTIVYAGALWRGSTSEMRKRAFERLGHKVLAIPTEPPADSARHLFARVLRRARRLLNGEAVNRRVLEALRAENADVLWIDKGLTIRPETLRQARRLRPRLRIASYSPDDMSGRHNQSRAYLDAVPEYDAHFTTKTYNVAELAAMGARRVYFSGNAFDPETHRPFPYSHETRRELGGPVGFIGAFEQERANQLLFLARQGVPVRVWGWSDWSRLCEAERHLRIEGRALWADDYARAISHIDINTCFLSKRNRDRQTTRSVEIPACAGFMLAERTDEHLDLFAEGREAEFFGDPTEMAGKIRFYLSNDEARRRVARAGYEKCLRAGYDYPSRMAVMLRQLLSKSEG